MDGGMRVVGEGCLAKVEKGTQETRSFLSSCSEVSLHIGKEECYMWNSSTELNNTRNEYIDILCTF